MMPANPYNRFPLWQYLSQPIGADNRKPIANPRQFWRVTKLRHIERCWVMSYVPKKQTM
ncbi:MAG: hypothetical protein WA783_23240 [Phormidesmis sp.]